MADKPKEEKAETPKVEKVERAVGTFERWLRILKEGVEGVGILGGIFSFLGLSVYQRRPAEGTDEKHGERSGSRTLLDEFFILNALFGNVPDRLLTKEEVGWFLRLIKKAGLSKFKTRKLFHLIGFEVETEIEDVGGKKIPHEVNLMGRKIIIGLRELGEARAIKLLTETPLLDNAFDTAHGWVKTATPWVVWLKNWVVAADLPTKTRDWLRIGITKTDQAILRYFGAANVADAERIVADRERAVADLRAQSWYERDLQHRPKLVGLWVVLAAITVLGIAYILSH